MKAPALRQLVPPKRILVAEDEPLVAQTVRMTLTVDGHSVELAQDGEQALALFRTGHHELVITDFKMTKMDGLELAALVKALSPATPVILITAYLESLKSTMGKVSNVDVLLGKPFSVMELHAALLKIFPQP